MVIIIIILSIIGLLISTYAYFIEKKLATDATYKPVCDISNRISCSKVIQSKYGTLFGINNAILGTLFYSVMLVLILLHHYALAFYASVAAVSASLIFAYILFFKLRLLCLICVSLYVLNALLLIATYKVMWLA